MAQLFKKVFTSCSLCLLKRSLFMTSACKYEGIGKTTITILNNNFEYGLMINSIHMNGFILNNGFKVIGPMVIFPKTILSWNIASSLDMNKEAFSLFLNLDPKLDILIIGLDNEYPYNAPFLQNIKDIFKKNKILIEILPVYHACGTFNFINSENRYGAAALIPPKPKNLKDLLLKNKSDMFLNNSTRLLKDDIENPLKLQDKSKIINK